MRTDLWHAAQAHNVTEDAFIGAQLGDACCLQLCRVLLCQFVVDLLQFAACVCWYLYELAAAAGNSKHFVILPLSVGYPDQGNIFPISKWRENGERAPGALISAAAYFQISHNLSGETGGVKLAFEAPSETRKKSFWGKSKPGNKINPLKRKFWLI